MQGTPVVVGVVGGKAAYFVPPPPIDGSAPVIVGGGAGTFAGPGFGAPASAAGAA